MWTSCLHILTISPAIPQQLYIPALRGLSAIAELLVQLYRTQVYPCALNYDWLVLCDSMSMIVQAVLPENHDCRCWDSFACWPTKVPHKSFGHIFTTRTSSAVHIKTWYRIVYCHIRHESFSGFFLSFFELMVPTHRLNTHMDTVFTSRQSLYLC